jgi:NAD-dependent deacetylase
MVIVRGFASPSNGVLMSHESDGIAKVVGYFLESKFAVAFTGAGISTESGISDFRSPGGVWTKYQPVYFQDFLASEDARRRYWQMRKEGYYEMKCAKPNDGHTALARLEAAGKIIAVITQNIDGLHQDAGSQRILELHGTNRYCICLKCGERFEADDIQERLEAGLEIPLCNGCGGFIKAATVSFGQSLPTDVLNEAFDLCANTDLMVAIGSSLVVEPAASLPLHAKQNGARLVIINRDETPLDSLADVVIHSSIGPGLKEITKQMGLSSS